MPHTAWEVYNWFFCGNWSSKDAPSWCHFVCSLKSGDGGYCGKLSVGRESGRLAKSARVKRERIIPGKRRWTWLQSPRWGLNMHLWVCRPMCYPLCKKTSKTTIYLRCFLSVRDNTNMCITKIYIYRHPAGTARHWMAMQYPPPLPPTGFVCICHGRKKRSGKRHSNCEQNWHSSHAGNWNWTRLWWKNFEYPWLYIDGSCAVIV